MTTVPIEVSKFNSLSARNWLLLILGCLTLFLPGFASIPPTDRDESRYVVTSERMADTGDFVDLRLQDRPRYLQPAGIYWLQATAAIVLDSPAHDSIWAYRVPSLLGALLAVLMTAWIGAYFFGRNAGLVAAGLLAACFSLNFEARIAKIDAALLASVLAAQIALMRAYVEPSVKRWVSAQFWAALGVGLMLKGPLILIVTGSTIAALVIWDRKIAWLRNLRPVWGPLITLAIAVPWFVAIGVITDGAFYERALMRNFLGKVGAGEQGHSGPPGYHLALFLFVFWPGSLLVLKSLGFVWRERLTPAVRFLICWIVPTWIVFEFVATKLPHYVLPTYPALALLAGAALFAASRPSPSPLGRFAFAAACILWLVASALMASGASVLLWITEHQLNGLAIALGAASFAAACFAVWSLSQHRERRAVGAMIVAAIFAWSGVFGVAFPGAHSVWMSPRIAATARAALACENGVLVTSPYSEPSLIFLFGRERTRLAESGADAADMLARVTTCGVALIGAVEQPDFIARARALNLSVQPVNTIEGRNYSNGDELSLTLYSTPVR